MRNPTPPERTTVAWDVAQSLRRNRFVRALRRITERISNRNRITRRFPKATAVLAWFLALAMAVGVYFLVLLADSKI
jgi:hypothetical protein